MAIIIGGVITSVDNLTKPPEKIVEKKEGRTAEEVKIIANKNVIKENDLQRKVVKSQPRKQYHPEDHLVVVNGKEKKIGKQSKYLLDMLTIDD